MQRTSRRTASWEIYSTLKARPPIVVRADGRGFKRILEGSKKPYDSDFARSMVRSAVGLFLDSGLSPALAFTFSDEISVLFLDAPFDCRVEKVDSVIASTISSGLSLALGRAVSMDCRLIPVCKSEILDYLCERQDEAWRNHVFSYGFYMLIEDGLTNAAAMERLRGMREHEIHELVFARGINLAKTPAWQRRGVLIYRRFGEVVEDWELPLLKDEEGHRLIEGILKA